MQNQQISSDFIRGHIDTIILHTLLDGDKFAEQISDAIDKKSDGAYKINQATLYSALKRLESLKYLNSYQQDAINGGRRKFFTLTQSGKNFAEDNLLSWSFSRNIIDKLIDCEPQPIVKTEYVEKIVQIPVERTVIKEIEVEKPVYIKETSENQISQQVQEPKVDVEDAKNDNLDIKADNESTQATQNDTQEVNFRNLLNGLIQSTVIQSEEKQKDAVQLSPIEKDDAPKQEPVKDFNQTISEKRPDVTNFELTDIDFSDLVDKANKEGFKINVSSKNANKPNGTLLKNKLDLFVSMTMFLVLSLELLFYVSNYKAILNIPTSLVLGLVSVFILWPIINLIIYKKSPKKTSAKNIYADSILATLIVVFNLLLINFAGVMLFNLDFAIVKDVLLYLAIPATIYIDLLIYSVVKFCFAKSKTCKIKTKK